MKKGLLFLFVLALATVAAWAEPKLMVQDFSSAVSKILLSENGKYVLLNNKNEFKFFDKETGFLINTFTVNEKVSYNSVDYSPDGLFFSYTKDVSYIPDMTVSIFSIEKNKVVFTAPGSLLRFSRDGKRFAVINRHQINVYDFQMLKKEFALENETGYDWSEIKFSPDSKYISAICDNKKRNVVWNLSSKKKASDFKSVKRIYHTAINYDSTYVTFAYENGGSVGISIRKIAGYDGEKTWGWKVNTASHKFECAVEEIDFAKNSDTLFCLDVDGVLLALNILTGSFQWKINDGSLAFSSSVSYAAEEVAFGLGDDIRIVNFKTGDLKKRLKNNTGILHLLPDFMYYSAAGHKPGNSSVYPRSSDAIYNGLEMKNLPYRFQYNSEADSGIGFIYDKRDNIYWIDFKTGAESAILPKDESRSVRNFKISRNGKVLAYTTSNDNYFYVYDRSANKFISRTVSEEGAGNLKMLSYGGKYISLGSAPPYDTSRFYEVATGKTIEKKIYPCLFSPNDKYVTDGDDIYATVSWKKVNKNKLKDVKKILISNYVCFSQQEDKLAVVCEGAENHFINLYDINGNVIRAIKTDVPNSRTLGGVSFSSDGSVLRISANHSGALSYSVKTGELLSTTVVDKAGEWMTYTPDGYYTGTDAAINQFVHFADGLNVYSLDQVSNTFYRPDLIAARLQGEDISKDTREETFAQVLSTGEPPLVSFVNPPASSKSRDITVNFTAQDQGGGVGSVYLKINGKVIQLADGSRKLALEGTKTDTGKKSNGNTMTFSHLLTLQNGENAIEAYATNSAGKIESRHASTKIAWQGKSAKPNLYVLSVGVNKYRDKSLWLQYSVPDAESISKAFGGQKTSLYQNIYTRELFDGDVTKEGLTAQFADLASKVNADDVFILFIAGHGTTNQKTGDYYFIPSNFRYTGADAIISQGVSKEDILKYMSSIKAGKTLIMLDTCNSGAFTNDKAMRGFVEKSALERLVRSTGQAVLTAASEEQSAMEGYNGHGIFTFVLLEALSGNADRDKDGYLTLNELASYIEEQVPELSYKKWGYEQVPMKELRKQDFPIVGK